MPRIFLVDAFADQPFTGNPAAVCLLDEPADERWMRSVAFEMNQAETAFLYLEGAAYNLRWFTPTVEVDLCGHATLASAHILWQEGLQSGSQEIQFDTRSGRLSARFEEGKVVLDFPAEPPKNCAPTEPIERILPHQKWFGRNRMDWFAVLESADEVRALNLDMDLVSRLGMRGLIVTAPGEGEVDFVSRFFAPQSGVPEDHATGSAHCCLGPYWAERLGRSELQGFQASPRGASIGIRVRQERVELIGSAITVLEGSFMG